MGAERSRGDLWAKKQKGWVQKLPGSILAGVPDWLHAGQHGVRLVEAKTLEACVAAGTPFKACSRAQQFFLRMLDLHGGPRCAAVLVLGVAGFKEFTVAQAQRSDWDLVFTEGQQRYGQAEEG